MEHQIVIARYNEDIRYLLNYSNISIVYNKGDNNIPLNFNYINLPNIGRESHTYLYHIIKNYENLANKTLFIQGNIKDHKLYPLNDYLYNKENFFGKKTKFQINFLKKHIKHEGKYLKELEGGYLKKSKYTPYEWINLLGIDISKINNFEMIWGANFSVSKNLIHDKPKIFYENLIKYLEYDNNPEEGHYFERSWNLIFNNCIFIKKKIILYDFFNINNINYKNIMYKYNSIIEFNYIEEIHLWSNNIIDKNIKIKYINNIKYESIYPDIVDSSFSIKINGNLNVLLNLNIKKYEFLFETNVKLNGDESIFSRENSPKNIKIIDYDTSEIICNLQINNYFEDYIITWKDNYLKLIYNNNIIFNILLPYNVILHDITIKSNTGAIINYNTVSELNIFNMICYNNYIDKDFYRYNFENFYIQSLTDFIFNH